MCPKFNVCGTSFLKDSKLFQVRGAFMWGGLMFWGELQ